MQGVELFLVVGSFLSVYNDFEPECGMLALLYTQRETVDGLK